MNAFVPVRALSAEHVLFNILAHIVDNWFRAHFVKYVTQNQVYINLKYCLYQQIYDILQTINTFINTGNFNKLLTSTLQRRHHERKGVSNHRRLDCLLNDLSRRRSKKTSKLRVTGLCHGNDRWPVDSPHKGPGTRKMFPFDYVIMNFDEVLYMGVNKGVPLTADIHLLCIIIYKSIPYKQKAIRCLANLTLNGTLTLSIHDQSFGFNLPQLNRYCYCVAYTFTMLFIQWPK